MELKQRLSSFREREPLPYQVTVVTMSFLERCSFEAVSRMLSTAAAVLIAWVIRPRRQVRGGTFEWETLTGTVPDPIKLSLLILVRYSNHRLPLTASSYDVVGATLPSKLSGSA